MASTSARLPTTSPQGIGTFKLWGVQDNFPGAGATTKFTRDLATVTNVSGIANGERAPDGLHPFEILTRIGPDALAAQLVESRAVIQRETGQTCACRK